MGGGGQSPQTSTQVSRKTEPEATASRRGNQRRIGASMFQTRTATPNGGIFGGTKQTLG